MPRIKRWFPVSQDINSDPEIWELTDRFGVTGLRAWLEILSIADRNDGELPGSWQLYARLLAGRCQSTTRHLLAVCQYIERWLVIDSQGTARIGKYAKYHISRETINVLRGKQTTSLPSEPSEPNLSKKALKSLPVDNSKSKEAFANRIDQAIGAVSNGDGEKAKAIQAWIRTKKEEVVVDPDGIEIVAQTLERLRIRESHGIKVQSYNRYLDTLYKKVRIDWKEGEAARLNNQRREP